MQKVKTQKVSVVTIRDKKARGEKITALTAYDYPTALVVDEAGVDIILVGDSVANVVLGYETTLPVTMEEMLHHLRAVRRAVKRSLLVADMPYLSYQISTSAALENAGRFLKAGGEAVKLEGAGAVLETVRALASIGIPVMGHIGFTPQWIHEFGGARVRGRQSDEALALLDAAHQLEEAGCFSIVLECVPKELAALMTERLHIPTIGIGSGPDCDGQILVLHDLLGLTPGWSPKHAKQYADVRAIIAQAVKGYVSEVLGGQFPANEHSFTMREEELVKLKASLPIREENK